MHVRQISPNETGSSLVQVVVTYCLFSVQWLHTEEHISINYLSKYKTYILQKRDLKCRLQNISHFSGLSVLCDNTIRIIYLIEAEWRIHAPVNIIASDNSFSPGRHQAIIWTKAVILLIGPLGTNFGEILIEIHTFSFKEIALKMSSGKWLPFYLGLNVLF